MQCKAHVTNSDKAFWVTKDKFNLYFDQDDFYNRNCKEVSKFYLSEWFFFKENSEIRFLLPVIHFVSGKTQFVSGRHRTAVLFLELEEIPLAFTSFVPNEFIEEIANGAVNHEINIEIPSYNIIGALVG